MFKLSISLVLIAGCAIRETSGDPIVRTNVGIIRGIKATDGDYSMFLGVPYGKIQDSNPFGLAAPYPDFDGVYSATNESVICPQSERGSLDCLLMNIFVPYSASTNNLLPVLVFFHGGGYEEGSNRMNVFNPRFLLTHDIIFVAMNYRVGVYGFMCLHTSDVPGNQGVKDQVLGLRWVRDHIVAFGGDAERVTIGGESAGSRSVDLHILSPYEQLFNNAIMQSGSTFNANWFPEPDKNAPVKLAQALRFETDDNMDAIAFLSTLDTRDVIEVVEKTGLVFKPCVEKQFDNVEPLLIEHPLNLEVPKAKETAILIGTATQEKIGSFMNKSKSFYDDLDLFRSELRDRFNFDENTLNKVEKNARNFYIGDEIIFDKVWSELADFESDLAYFHDATRNVNKFLENGAEKVYYYLFDYRGKRNYVRRLFNLPHYVGGTAHADERGYLFDVANMTESPSSEDQLMIDRMTTLWTNFVKYGDPTPQITSLLPVKWVAVTEGSLYFMNITSPMNLGTRPFNSRIAFWDLFYSQYGEYEKGFRKIST